MNPFIVSVYPELEQLGGTRALSGTLEEEKLVVGGTPYGLPHGIAYDIMLSNTGEGILLTGTASCTLDGECARCLGPASTEVSGEVQGYYLLKDAEELDGYERDEFDCLDSEGNFDIAGPLEAAIVYSMPFVLLCKEDCAGLCPHCGADLNEGPCDCANSDEIDPDNPFAVLKNLKFDEGE